MKGTCVKISLIAIILLFLLMPVLAQNLTEPYEEISKNIIKTALKDQKGYHLLKELCDIGPRLSGYPGSFAAIDWILLDVTEYGFIL